MEKIKSNYMIANLLCSTNIRIQLITWLSNPWLSKMYELTPFFFVLSKGHIFPLCNIRILMHRWFLLWLFHMPTFLINFLSMMLFLCFGSTFQNFGKSILYAFCRLISTNRSVKKQLITFHVKAELYVQHMLSLLPCKNCQHT